MIEFNDSLDDLIFAYFTDAGIKDPEEWTEYVGKERDSLVDAVEAFIAKAKKEDNEKSDG